MSAIGTIVNMPLQPYSTTIKLPFYSVGRSDGTISIYDNGSAYDVRETSFIWAMKASIATRWTTFMQDRNRWNAFDMVTNGVIEFYPFGPDLKTDQTYSVRIIDAKNKGLQSKPYLYHRFDVNLVMMTSSPTTDVPVDTDCTPNGSITVGDITGVTYTEFFDPSVYYSFSNAQTRDGTVYAIHPGNDNDYETTILRINATRIKAAQLINYLLGTARANTFTLTVPSNSYPFGYEQGDNKSFSVKLDQKEIKISHNRYDNFTFDLRLRKV